jgi:hypothetical protein
MMFPYPNLRLSLAQWPAAAVDKQNMKIILLIAGGWLAIGVAVGYVRIFWGQPWKVRLWGFWVMLPTVALISPLWPLVLLTALEERESAREARKDAAGPGW